MFNVTDAMSAFIPGMMNILNNSIKGLLGPIKLSTLIAGTRTTS